MHHLIFDNQYGFGSSEHFYHFLWGYLLPGVSQVLKIQDSSQPAGNSRFLFHTCGPVMDGLLHETASLFDIEYRIVDRDHSDPVAKRVLLPRWDIELAMLTSATRTKLNQSLNSRQSARKASLTDSISKVKSAFMKRAISPQVGHDAQKFADKFLILRRSAQPVYYEPGGQAEIKGYGVARRTLVGLEQSIELLRSQNMPVALFEPGSVSLAEQVGAFAACRGIAGIYGAEFANVLWLPPDTPVIWIYNKNADRMPWITGQLCELLRLRFIPVRANDDDAPELPLAVLREWL